MTRPTHKTTKQICLYSCIILEHTNTSYSRYITYSFYEPQRPRNSHILCIILGAPALRIPVILCIVLGALAHKTIHNIHYAPFGTVHKSMSPGAKNWPKFRPDTQQNGNKKIRHKKMNIKYKHHTGAHNNKSHDKHKIIAQTSPHRQTFYNLHDICRIPDNHHFYHHDIIRNNKSTPRPRKTALFCRPPHQLPHNIKTKHAPRRRRTKTQKKAEIRRFFTHSTTQITVICDRHGPLS